LALNQQLDAGAILNEASLAAIVLMFIEGMDFMNGESLWASV
jgi:hypothetical protein